jgi:hypothetical protein
MIFVRGVYQACGNCSTRTRTRTRTRNYSLMRMIILIAEKT